jgi:hypothetical protein
MERYASPYARQCIGGKGKRPPKVPAFTLERRSARSLTTSALAEAQRLRDVATLRAGSGKKKTRRAADQAAVAAFIAAHPDYKLPRPEVTE